MRARSLSSSLSVKFEFEQALLYRVQGPFVQSRMGAGLSFSIDAIALKLKLGTAVQAEVELYRAMWEQSMDDCLDRLVRNGTDGLVYVGAISQVRMRD